MKFIFTCLFSTLIYSCTTERKQVSINDTAAIIHLAIDNSTVIQDYNSDSLYFIQGPHVNKAIFNRVEKFKIGLISDEKRNKTLALPKRPLDQRTRFEINKISVNSDSAYISIYGFSGNTNYKYWFKNSKDGWVISKTEHSVY